MLLIAVLCSAKTWKNPHPTGFEYFCLPFASTESHAADIERGFEPYIMMPPDMEGGIMGNNMMFGGEVSTIFTITKGGNQFSNISSKNQ